MLWRKKQTAAYEDATTNGLLGSGVYTLNRHDSDEEQKMFKRKERTIFSGVWYVFILSCLLWWLPPFGQMIAGYLGGRKAGTPIRGVIVTVIPALIILMILIGWDIGLFPFLGAFVGFPNTVYHGLYAISPNAASFLLGIYNSLMPVFGLEGSGFVVIVTFGLIGGMMADMNKKEILYATGGGHFYDAFLNRFSGANLTKFADMVAERVLWTLGSVEQGSAKLAGRTYYEPTPLGFDKMRSLPPAHQAVQPQPISSPRNIPSRYDEPFGYDDYSYNDDIFYEKEPIPIIPQDPPKRGRRERPKPPEPYDEDRSLDHRDPMEDLIADSSKEKKDSEKSKRKSGQNIKHTRERVFDKKPKKEEKRDALIYDGQGKLMKDKTTKRKTSANPFKKKRPAIVERAMESNKEVKEEKTKVKKEKDLIDILAEKKEEITPPKRVKKEQSFDRL